MILVWLILILLLAGAAAWLLGRRDPALARWIALAAVSLDLVLLAGWFALAGVPAFLRGEAFLAEVRADWIPQLGIGFHLAMDGLGFLFLALTFFLGLLAVGCSWREIEERQGFFYFNLLWVLAGVAGVFVAFDLFLFYFFWEVMLVPMYFLIGIWGHEDRIYASIKFFLFTQASGLLMLVAIVGLWAAHGRHTGTYTFDLVEIRDNGAGVIASMGPATAMWLMLGFLIAFVVKLPAVPFHTWLPDAHTEAPTAGSVVLAGLLLKTGAYGILRFVLPLFPEQAMALAPWAAWLGAAGILYGALLAFAQTDLKRLVAYSSVSHMGFVLLGVFAGSELALQGVVLQVICHGLSTGGLFILAGSLQERLHTRDLARMGGLWDHMPRMGAAGLFLAMASLGLPGLGNFVGEFLVLLGSYRAGVEEGRGALVAAAIVATCGLVPAAVYSLWIVQRAFQGRGAEDRAARDGKISDLDARELAIAAALVLALIGLGLYPRPVLDTAGPAVDDIREAVTGEGDR